VLIKDLHLEVIQKVLGWTLNGDNIVLGPMKQLPAGSMSELNLKTMVLKAVHEHGNAMWINFLGRLSLDLNLTLDQFNSDSKTLDEVCKAALDTVNRT